MDEAGFDRLLAMAGPQGARDLVAQLQTDLASARADLDAGFAADDLSAVKAAAHVLVALAGTVGTRDAHDAARLLHDAAASGDRDGAAHARYAAMAGVATLAALLAARAFAIADAGTEPGARDGSA